MRKVKCQYCGGFEDKNLMVTDPNCASKPTKYYHSECLVHKNNRKKALDLFYSYTESYEMSSAVYLVFKKIRDKGLTDTDVLYIMEYVAKNKCVLRYPMGLLYYVDKAMKDKKERERADKFDERISSVPIRIAPLRQKTEQTKDEESDISDLI